MWFNILRDTIIPNSLDLELIVLKMLLFSSYLTHNLKIKACLFRWPENLTRKSKFLFDDRRVQFNRHKLTTQLDAISFKRIC